MNTTAEAGAFYAVGVGPGDPDLVTLRAAALVHTADVLIAPRSARSDASMALAIVEAHRPPEGQELIDHVYPMTRDDASTRASWEGVADTAAAHCEAGRSVVQITLGDPLVYSTSSYLIPPLLERLGPERVRIVPGISAFQAAAVPFAEALTLQEDRMLVMTATDLDAVAEALDRCETLVLYKAGRHVEALADLLDARGLADRARLVCYAGQEDREYVTRDLRSAADGRHGYLATVIIHVGRRPWEASAP
ncbi:MAG: precorrin-2 C(20)-methyltransferase [Planctomycetota bacterium]